MAPPFVDTHTHLESFARRGEAAAVIARAREAGVGRMITIGTGPDDWDLYRGLAEAHPAVVDYAVGVHPCSVGEQWRGAVEALGAWAERRPGPVAVGETGLDRFHLPKHDPAAAARIFAWQQEAFRAHLALAARWGLPVVVHSRGAAAECIAAIDAAGFDWARVVFHCFADGPETMAEVVRRGGRGSFTGIVTYKNAENVRRAALAQGLDRLMVETDAPYLTPEPHRGKPNEPALVVHTAAALAAVFGVAPEELAEVTTRNAKAFFGM